MPRSRFLPVHSRCDGSPLPILSVCARVGGGASCLGGKTKKRKVDGEPKTADDVPAAASSGLEAGGSFRPARPVPFLSCPALPLPCRVATCC